jgi:hypothetical protein
MTYVTYDEPEEALRDVHEKFVTFIRAWDELVQFASNQRGGRFGASVDAYQPFVRDQGMGDDPFDWMQAAAEEFDLEIKWGRSDDDPDKFELRDIVTIDIDEGEDA